MNKIIVFIITVTLFIASCQSSAENETVEVTEDIVIDTTQTELYIDCPTPYEYHESTNDSLNSDSIILVIKENFQRINSIKKWTDIEVIEIWDESTEGGEMKLYFNGDVLEKFSVKLFGEMGQDLTEYYLRIGRLDFVYEKRTEYNTHIMQAGFDIEKSSINEVRNYFSKGKLIKQINDLDSVNLEDEKEKIQLNFFHYTKMLTDSSKVWKSQSKLKSDIFLW